MVVLVLNAICPLVCFPNIVMMVKIASQRVRSVSVLELFFSLHSYLLRGSFPPIS